MANDVFLPHPLGTNIDYTYQSIGTATYSSGNDPGGSVAWQLLNVFVPNGPPPPGGWPVFVDPDHTNFTTSVLRYRIDAGGSHGIQFDTNVVRPGGAHYKLLQNGVAVVSVKLTGRSATGAYDPPYAGKGFHWPAGSVNGGWSTWNAAYEPFSDLSKPTAVKDLGMATQWIKANADMFDFDITRMALGGRSAGTYISANIAYGPDFAGYSWTDGDGATEGVVAETVGDAMASISTKGWKCCAFRDLVINWQLFKLNSIFLGAGPFALRNTLGTPVAANVPASINDLAAYDNIAYDTMEDLLWATGSTTQGTFISNITRGQLLDGTTGQLDGGGFGLSYRAPEKCWSFSSGNYIGTPISFPFPTTGGGGGVEVGVHTSAQGAFMKLALPDVWEVYSLPDAQTGFEDDVIELSADPPDDKADDVNVEQPMADFLLETLYSSGPSVGDTSKTNDAGGAAPIQISTPQRSTQMNHGSLDTTGREIKPENSYRRKGVEVVNTGATNDLLIGKSPELCLIPVAPKARYFYEGRDAIWAKAAASTTTAFTMEI